MADLFAFRDSTSSTAEADIVKTMEEIKNTLESNRKAVNALKPEWGAIEGDMYYETIAKWNEGADGLANTLKKY